MGGKKIANDMTDKESISKVYTQLIQLNIKKKKNPIKKWTEDLNRNADGDTNFSNKVGQTSEVREATTLLSTKRR